MLSLLPSAICRLSFGEDIHAQTTEEGNQLLSAWEKWLFSTNLLMLINVLAWDGAWKTLGRPLLKKYQAGKDAIYGGFDCTGF